MMAEDEKLEITKEEKLEITKEEHYRFPLDTALTKEQRLRLGGF